MNKQLKQLIQISIFSIIKIFLIMIVCLSMTGCCSAASKLASINNKEETQVEDNNQYNNQDNQNSENKSGSQDSQNSNSQIPATKSEPTMAVGNVVVAKVTRISDGDTIWVDALDNSIRLPSVNTAEINTTAGQNAKAFVSNLIPVGSTVWIETDTKDTEVHGRYIRNVWIEDPGKEVTPSKLKSKNLDGILVANGLATPQLYSPKPKYYDWLSAY